MMTDWKGWGRLDRESEIDEEWGRVGKSDHRAESKGECRGRVMAKSEGECTRREWIGVVRR